MRWLRSWKADPLVAELADRHYSRRKPGARQFAPPGRTLVLRTEDARAAWVTSWPNAEFTTHGLGDAFVCSLFRNEAPDLYLSSELVLEAVAATRARFECVPQGGFLTFVDAGRTRRKRDPGRCFRRAGFAHVGFTKDRGLYVLALEPGAFPDAELPLEVQLTL